MPIKQKCYQNIGDPTNKLDYYFWNVGGGLLNLNLENYLIDKLLYD